MRKALIAVILLALTIPLSAQEMSYEELASVLTEILNDYETAYQEISLGLTESRVVWNDIGQQVNDLEQSFGDYKTEIEAEIIKIISDQEKDHEAEIRALKIGNWITVGITVFATGIIGYALGTFF